MITRQRHTWSNTWIQLHHKRKFDPEFAAAEQAEKAAKKAAKEIDAESDKAGVEDEKAAKKATRAIKEAM